MGHTKEFCVAFFSFVGTFYGELLAAGFGGGTNAAAKQAAWDSVDLFILTLLECLGQARQGGVHAHTYPQLDKDVAYMGVLLRSHQVQHEFMQCNFKEHGDFMPKLVNKIFATMVTKAQLQVVEAAAQAASSAARQATNSVDTLRRRVDTVDSRVNANERNRNRRPRGQGQEGDSP